MTTEYLGETELDWKTHPEFKDFTPADWALLFIERYGGYDGSHHKDWVLDQIARILKGSEIKVTEANWSNGESEFRYDVGESEEYKNWVIEMTTDEDGEIIYDYETGIAP
jgi:hypothetical protein